MVTLTLSSKQLSLIVDGMITALAISKHPILGQYLTVADHKEMFATIVQIKRILKDNNG